MHKCDGCAYKGEHREMGFMSQGVCLRERDLGKAVIAFDSPFCPHGGNTRSTYSQVSKALCGKENATLDELLQAVNQLKSRLAQVERERDSLLRDLQSALETPCASECDYCARQYETGDMCDGCRFIWRGVCPENTKEETK